MENSKVVLEVKNLKKYFYNSNRVVKAIDDVAFQLHEGQIVGLIGESGSGKTTVGRTLIRLYPDFNGLVSLNNQVLSGNRIPKDKSKFLHRNMQMIFQDPHASLNSQQNVYTILREPLVVNGILRIIYKDVFKDLKDVQFFYRNTFEEKLLVNRIKIFKGHTITLRKFIKKWRQNFKEVKFNQEETLENNFNAIFSFLEDRQQTESKLVSSFYDSIGELFNFYFQKRADFRNEENLEVDELVLKKATEDLERAKALSKQSRKVALQKRELSKRSEALKALEKVQKENLTSTTEYLSSYRREFKNDSALFKLEFEKQEKIEEYNRYKQQYYIYRAMGKTLKDNYKSLVYLSLAEAQKFIHELKKYKNQTQIEIFEPSINTLDDAKVKEYLSNNFKFKIEPYLLKASANRRQRKSAIAEIKAKVTSLTKEIKEVDSTINKPGISQADLQKVEAAYEKAKAENQKFLDDYRAKIAGAVAKAKEHLVKVEALFKKEDKRINKLLAIFDTKFTEFLTFVKEKIEAQDMSEITQEASSKKALFAKNPRQQEILRVTQILKSNVAQKKESLKSFQIELEQLARDTLRLEHLFGLKKDLTSHRKIKKLVLNEKIYRALDEVGLLRQFAWRYPHEFSGGQRQRIVIARALISDPKVIIADEPIASLDVSIQAQIVNLLKDLSKEKNIALLFIAHDLSMVEYIADYIHIMHLGKVVESGSVVEIFKNPIHPYTKNLFDSIPKISNANIPFESSNFTLGYLEEQTVHNKPKLHKLNNDHFLYATEDQKNRWV